jgi:myo-inositol-hexaphosphate 3-phosphohydrolase
MSNQATTGHSSSAPPAPCRPRTAWLSVALAAGTLLVIAQPAGPAQTAPVQVTPTVETSPALNSGDAIDDPSVWIHPTDRSLSTIIETDKRDLGGLNVHNLAGQRLYFYGHGRMNNVDIRYNFPLGGSPVDLVGASNRAGTLDFYKVNVADRSLTSVGSVAVSPAIGEPLGFALYYSADSGKYYAFVTDNGKTEQYELSGATGAVTGTLVRQFTLPSQTEGLVADDERKRIYVGEEDIGIWRFGAEPGDGTTGIRIDSTAAGGGHLVADVEGLSIYYASGGAGYLLAASQGSNAFHIYNRGDNAHLGEFQIVADNGIDEVTGQDGSDVTNVALGSAFPQGLFVTQDDSNTNAGNGNGGNQNTKIVPWQAIANAFTPPLTIDTSFNPRAADSDGDGVLNASDNCPYWPNPAQTTPWWFIPANDPDCDGFSSPVENSAGTEPLDHCGANAWPADIDNDGFSDISDISVLTGNFGMSVPPAPRRQDIAPDPVDGFVDITDISRLVSVFSLTCTAPAGP